MPLARTQPATHWHTPPEVDHAANQAAGSLLPDLHPLVDRLLRARGVADREAAERFLTPKLTHLHDPAVLPGCIKAAQRLKQAVDDKQPIIIYGDYDVDGVTASAILYHTLTAAGADVSTYVPHRLEEGYGINAEAVTTLANSLPPPPWKQGQGRVANHDADITRQPDQYSSAPSRVVELRYARQLSPQQIAEQVGASTTAVTTMLHRVRNALRVCVSNYLESAR